MPRISAGAAVAPSPQLLRTVYGLLLVGAFLWCAAVLCAPLLLGLGEGLEKPARVLYDFFGRVCHQRDDHCLHLGGAKLAVCARCFAIYAAFLGGLLVYPLLRPLRSFAMPHRALLAAALLPMLADVGLSWAGLHGSTQASRLWTGTAFGLIMPFYLLPPLLEGAVQLAGSRRRTAPGSRPPSHPSIPPHSQEGSDHATET